MSEQQSLPTEAPWCIGAAVQVVAPASAVYGLSGCITALIPSVAAPAVAEVQFDGSGEKLMVAVETLRPVGEFDPWEACS